MGFTTFNPKDTKTTPKKFTLCVSASHWVAHAQVKLKAVKKSPKQMRIIQILL